MIGWLLSDWLMVVDSVFQRAAPKDVQPIDHLAAMGDSDVVVQLLALSLGGHRDADDQQKVALSPSASVAIGHLRHC